jgi:preprotein translocase subunit SecD
MRRGIASIPRILAVAVLFLNWCPPASAEPLALEIKQAKADIQGSGNEPVLIIVLTDASARIFAEVTGKNVGKAIDIRVDGRSVLKPIVREPILGGTLAISGRFSRNEANEIAGRLSSGVTKLEFEIISPE